MAETPPPAVQDGPERTRVDLPDEIVEAATEAVSMHFYHCDAGQTWRDCELCVLQFDRAKRTILAALPFLLPSRKPRMECPVCQREVVRRDNGQPTNHWPPRDRPDLACKRRPTGGRCRGSCPCRTCEKERDSRG